jgi:hypothetical protein
VLGPLGHWKLIKFAWFEIDQTQKARRSQRRVNFEWRQSCTRISTPKWDAIAQAQIIRLKKKGVTHDKRGKGVQKKWSKKVADDADEIQRAEQKARSVHYGSTNDTVAVKIMEGNQSARVTVMLTWTSDTRYWNHVWLKQARAKQHATMQDQRGMMLKEG